MMRPLTMCLLVTLSSTQGWTQEVHQGPPVATASFTRFVENEFVVVLNARATQRIEVRTTTAGDPRVNIRSLQRLLERFGAEKIVRQFPGPPPEPRSRVRDLSGYYQVRLRAGADLEAAVAAFAADPNVEHVETIGLHPVSLTPNDPFYQNPPPPLPFDQWNLWGVHGIDADQAWEVTPGDSNVVVAILDTGVRYFHTDLGGWSLPWGPDAPLAGGNIYINDEEIPGNGLDDDANGFIDDTLGWDFVSEVIESGVACIDGDCADVDNDPDDFDGHGTLMAGVVGATTHNNHFIAGIAGGFGDGTTTGQANGVKILPLRIGFHALVDGSVVGVVRMDWAAQAMNYVAALVDRGVNVVAVNCSWGSSDSGGISAAIDNLLAHDVMVIHAAGNDSSSVAGFLGTKPGVMNVAATDINGNGAEFTNFGTWVDVAAPGVDILSTYRNPADPDSTHNYVVNASGTSMAAPHLCGIAALLESCNPGLTGTQKFALIVNNTDPYVDARILGSGIANARRAFDAAALCAGTTSSVTVNPPSPGAMTWIAPNPFNPGAHILLRLETPDVVSIVIYDVAGRTVRHLFTRSLGAGVHQVVFDGHDDRGAPLASGLYLSRVATRHRVETRKLVLQK